MRTIVRQIIGVISAVIVAACGAGGSLPPATTPQRGDLLRTPPELLATVPLGTALALLSTAARQQFALEISPVCDIVVYRIRYETVGGANEATSASGALMVPIGSAPQCNGSRPIVLYAHGTSTERLFNIGDLSASSNTEGLLLAIAFASQGYIVVAPNYAGYDTSSLPYHPYLVADQAAKDMIDALRAARLALPVASLATVRDDGRLFVTGYSQGGYVALATQRAMQAVGMPVTAAAPMSGPYSLAAFVDAVFLGQVNASGPVSAAFLITAYQHVYGGMYGDPLEVFEARYATGISTLLPGSGSRSDLYVLGKLPATALFSATPPDATFTSITPATSPANLIATFGAGFGGGNLVTNDFRARYVADARAQPDGAWPTVSTGRATTTATLALRQALSLNDLRGWSPVSPVMLCGGSGDPTVFWFNTELIDAYWGSLSPAPSAVTVLDVDSAALANDPYRNVKLAFAVAKASTAAAAILNGATDGGASAIADDYHATLVPPACLTAVTKFFDTF